MKEGRSHSSSLRILTEPLRLPEAMVPRRWLAAAVAASLVAAGSRTADARKSAKRGAAVAARGGWTGYWEVSLP